ncbi:MAG TPA: hypothetical protein VHX88_11910 [Solirubrobacteraceae bacterium]|jgi:hypothetical protein|nr:hypothetical protein [Solirubrobacteraceae bacterium]
MSMLQTPTAALASPRAGTAEPSACHRSPEIAWREVLYVALGGLAVAIFMSWPLVLHMGSRISPDLGDPVRTAWQVAFGGHQLLHDPGNLWNSNAFWPHPDSFLFSDTLLGYAPTAFIGSGPVAALVRYNLLWLFAYAFTFAAAYLLAREFGTGRAGGLVAGMAFAYAPYRLDEAGHLHVVSAGGVALTFFLLLRGYRRRHRGLVLAGWLVAAWQMSLGFTLGLQLAYTMLILAVIVAVFAWRERAALREMLRREREVMRRLAVVSVIGMAIMGSITGIEGHAYLRVSNEYPNAKRSLAIVKTYSANLDAFVSAPADNRIWGKATAGARAHVSSKNESSLFPGATILILAAIGLGGVLYTRRQKLGLATGVVVSAIVSLGLNPTFGNITYKPLFDHAPGFDGIRVPDRFVMMTSLFLALLAAAGAYELQRRLRERSLAGALGRVAPPALACLLPVMVFVEGTGHIGHPRVPRLPSGLTHLASLPQPMIMLPTSPAYDREYQYFSTQGFPEIANGNSTFDIPQQDDLRGAMSSFPSASSVDTLRGLGFRTAILFTDLVGNPEYPIPPDPYASPLPGNPRAAAVKSIAGLGITRRTVGDVVIFNLDPARPPAGAHA